MRVLITGASGLLGSNLLLQWSDRYCLTATARRPMTLDSVKALPLEITRTQDVCELFERVRPEVVVHTAAMTGVDACEEDPAAAYKINVEGTRSVAQAAGAVGAYLVHLSSDYVFDGTQGNYKETDPVHPLGVYAKTKWEAEQAVTQSGSQAAVVRTTIYGWNAQEKFSFAERILWGAIEDKPATGFKDMYWTPILVNDLGDALEALISAKATGTFHVASRERTSRHAFGLKLLSVFGYEEEKLLSGLLSEAKLKAPRPVDASLDVSLFEKTTGFKLPDGLAGLMRMRQLESSGWVPRLKALL